MELNRTVVGKLTIAVCKGVCLQIHAQSMAVAQVVAHTDMGRQVRFAVLLLAVKSIGQVLLSERFKANTTSQTEVPKTVGSEKGI